MIIGVTGLFASGKDVVAKYLKKRGFIHISLSDFLREDLKKQNVPITRDSLWKHGNKLREAKGPAILAERALKKVQPGRNYIISSIRNPKEVEALKTKDFILINIQAPDKKRAEWIKERHREHDPQTLKQLKEKEKLEMTNNPTHQQLHVVIKMADFTINNDSTLKDLHKKLDKLLEEL